MAKKPTTKKTTAKKTSARKPAPKKAPAKAGSAKTPAKPTNKQAAEPKARKVSALDAAAKVLAASKAPMSCKDLIKQMESKGLWKSPGGKTPSATLYSAIIREIARKGKESRFTKAERGRFAATKGAKA